MSNEEWERKMNFIVEQQAQFSVDIQLLREAQKQTEQIVAETTQTVAETTRTVAKTAQTVAGVGEIVARLANVTLVGFREVNAKIDVLVDSQIRSDEKFNLAQIRADEKFEALANSQISFDEKFKALTDSQIRTDEKLRKFIAGLDRYIKGGRNGS